DGEARATVVSWYLAHARARVGHRVAHFAPLVGAAPAAVVVRDLGRHRWGTCHSRTRTVTFHWELILQPPEILDYVVVHELTHLHAPDHGPGFWRRVESVLPDWKRRRAWLSGHGQRHVV
ncbi:MAG: M48 family metallopeptidase, partial [Thermoleophilia bacterium]